MCGIAGWRLNDHDLRGATELQRMLEAISHRGPDDTGTYIGEGSDVAVGHNRLSIIDLTPSGHQPMVNCENGDVLAFNGEIYNFRELRLQLQELGYRFRSESDTEVLLFAFAAWGTECVNHIRGMFTFVIWRSVERALFLFRDPMGIKPLYYWEPPGGGIVFASELKAFLVFPGFRATLDRRAIGQFLEFGYTFDEDRTILSGVCKLRPGHFLRLRANEKPLLERYFYPKVASSKKTDLIDIE